MLVCLNFGIVEYDQLKIKYLKTDNSELVGYYILTFSKLKIIFFDDPSVCNMEIWFFNHVVLKWFYKKWEKI